jgi:hypothetical protein
MTEAAAQLREGCGCLSAFANNDFSMVAEQTDIII